MSVTHPRSLYPGDYDAHEERAIWDELAEVGIYRAPAVCALDDLQRGFDATIGWRDELSTHRRQRFAKRFAGESTVEVARADDTRSATREPSWADRAIYQEHEPGWVPGEPPQAAEPYPDPDTEAAAWTVDWLLREHGSYEQHNARLHWLVHPERAIAEDFTGVQCPECKTGWRIRIASFWPSACPGCGASMVRRHAIIDPDGRVAVTP